jgi:hypothetical protein
MLLVFWRVVQTWSPQAVIGTGAALMATATWLEYRVGRAWLRRHPGA